MLATLQVKVQPEVDSETINIAHFLPPDAPIDNIFFPPRWSSFHEIGHPKPPFKIS